jgi:hypothetical protein
VYPHKPRKIYIDNMIEIVGKSGTCGIVKILLISIGEIKNHIFSQNERERVNLNLRRIIRKRAARGMIKKANAGVPIVPPVLELAFARA